MHSAAARAGLGPPEWIVIGIILALVFAVSLEGGGASSSSQIIALSRRDKWTVVALIGLIVSLIAFAAWR